MIGLAVLVAGIVNYSNEPSTVFFSVGLLYIILAVVLLLWGVLGELVYRAGDLKMEHFAQIKRNVREEPKV